MYLKLTGILKSKTNIRSISGNLSVQDFTISYEVKDKNVDVDFEIWNDRTTKLQKVNEGDPVSVTFIAFTKSITTKTGKNIRITKLRCYEIETIDNQKSESQNEGDDLPF